jgi:hypothetical protein
MPNPVIPPASTLEGLGLIAVQVVQILIVVGVVFAAQWIYRRCTRRAERPSELNK